MKNSDFFRIVTATIFFVLSSAGLRNPVFAQSTEISSTLLKDQYISILNTSSTTVSEKREALDSLFLYYLREGDTIEAYVYEMKKAHIFSDFGNSFEAYAIYKSILQELPFLKNTDPKKDTLLRTANLEVSVSAWQSAFWEEALGLTFDFLRQYTVPTPVELAQAYSNIGIIHMNLDNMEISKLNHQRALDIVNRQPDLFSTELRVRISNAMAGWYYLNGKYDSSLYILLRIEQYDVQKLSPIQFTYLYNNISLNHSTIGNYKIALDYLNKALKHSNSLSESNYIKSHILRNFGWLYRQEKKYGLAEYYYKEALKYAQNLDDRENIWRVAIEFGELYEEMGDTNSMQKYLLQGYIIKDQVSSRQNQQRTSLLSRDFELFKISKQQEILQQTLELERLGNQKKIILLIVLGSLLAIFFAIIIFMVFKLIRTSKLSKSLSEKLLNNEENSREQIRRKEQDLATATLFTVQKDETLKTLKQTCSRLLHQCSDEKIGTELKEMLRLINTCYYGSSWDEFRLRFDMSYPEFYPNLQGSGVALTKSEKYLCALLALNTNAKEISSMTRKSVRSIETYIYRLRKKLNIPPEVNSNDYFRSFLGKSAEKNSVDQKPQTGASGLSDQTNR